jgi:serine/threonine protein kinase
MNRQRDRKLIELFDAALDRPPQKRASFVEHACADEPELQGDLEAMLAADAGATRVLGGQRRAAPDISTDETVSSPAPDMALTDERTGPERPAITPGMRLDRYELIREIGRGGMGTVYVARDTRLGRRVAIKFLQSRDPRLTERFIVEAQATARCSHESIVVIHDVKELSGHPFMVLEYLKGQSFSDLIGDDRLPPGRAVQLMVPVVRALECAHRHKIVHRDLKPANIFMTDTGTIKVLDFGIAKFVYEQSLAEPANPDITSVSTVAPSLHLELTSHGMLVGTLPYMSPEQWGADTIDHRTDLWAVGIMLYRMVVGRHPLAPLGGQQLMVTAVLEQPMPSAHNTGVDMPLELADIIDRCLEKRKERRMPSATKLLEALEPLLPGRRPVELNVSESPYTGLNAFQESDANRFFGRVREIGTVVAQLHGAPMIGIVGPSGAGKSSFVRAGVIPALKHSGETWETMIIRPGRHPMAALANIVVPMITTAASNLSDQVAEHQAALQRLYSEPGYLGTVLRSRAHTSHRKILLFVDQFEELYTLIRDADERRAFTACLTGMADDALSPLRLVLSIRSDFLDRVAEDRQFMSELSQHLVFVGPPDRAGLREAIIRPAEMMRYRFETPAMVEHMLDTLQATPGCLPLLQFAATKLWEARNIDRRLLTEQSYRQIGGVAGALATHADAVLAALPPRSQALARTIFLQLVTPERTRAIASVTELCEFGETSDEVERVIQQLVDARLLVIQRSNRAGSATVEIVHESLIHSWPALAHWLDENQDDAVFLEQLRTAAKQWEARARSLDLLWRGDVLEEARSWRRRYRGPLPPLQEEFLRAAFALASRATRIKRAAVAGTITFLSLLIVAAAVALVAIRKAEQRATEQAVAARQAEKLAEEKAAEAIAAHEKIREQLDIIREKEAAREAAQTKAETFEGRATQSEADLARKNRELEIALRETTSAKDLAEVARTRLQDALRDANAARQEVQKLLDKERERAERLEKQLGTSRTGVMD